MFLYKKHLEKLKNETVFYIKNYFQGVHTRNLTSAKGRKKEIVFG